MIRVDLGRPEGAKKPPGLEKIVKDFLAKLNGGKPPKINTKFLGDVKGLMIIGVAGAIACLPHLFFTQFRSYVIDQHAERVAQLEEKLGQLNREIEKLTPFQRELESYNQQKKLVRERLDIVRDLLQNRGTPVNVLDAIGQSLPQRAWLNTLDFSIADTGASIKMTGQSYTNEDISDFLDKLSESVHLTDVKLEEVVTNAAREVEVRAFKLTALPKVKMGPARAAAAAPAPAGAQEAPSPGTPPPGGDAPPQPANGGKVAPPEGAG